jgi:hypothetical protein
MPARRQRVLAADIVIGTTSPAKARQCEQALAGSGVVTTRLADLLEVVPKVPEDAHDPAANAAKKAIAYAKLVERPVVALDYALVFDGVAEDEQPGVNVRRIPGVAGDAGDEAVLEYYAALFRRYGGSVRGYWQSGVAAAAPGGALATASVEVSRVFVSNACATRVPGHPLASLQLVGDRYAAELEEAAEVALMRETLRVPLLAVLEGVFAQE